MAKIPGLPPGSTRLVTCAAFIYGLGLFFLLFTIIDIIAYVCGYENPYLPAGIGICASLAVILLGIGAVIAPSMWRKFKLLRAQYKSDKLMNRQATLESMTAGPSSVPNPLGIGLPTARETFQVQQPLIDRGIRSDADDSSRPTAV